MCLGAYSSNYNNNSVGSVGLDPCVLFTGQCGEASDSSLLSRQGSREGEAAAAPVQAAATVKDTQDSPMRRSESKMKAMLRDEVLINAQKFKIQVFNTITCTSYKSKTILAPIV